MLNDAGLVIAANAVDAAITHFSIHTAGAVTASTNESTAARVAVNGTVDADGDITWSNAAFTGGAANGPAIRVGYWTAASGGTYLGGFLLTGDQTFNAAGQYTVTSGAENFASS